MKKIANFIKEKFTRKKAFSLIELSIVLLIIGIIIAGVTNASSLIRKYQLSTARQLTQNAPMNAMTGIMFWVETTAEESFDVDIENGSAISTWRDLNATSNTKYNAVSSGSNRPTYTENCIKGLPCLSFDGVDDYIDNTVSASLTSFTIFVITKYTNPSVASYILSSVGVSESLNMVNDGYFYMYIRSDGMMQNQVGYAGNSTVIGAVSQFIGLSFPYLLTFSERNGVTLSTRANKVEQTSAASTYGGTQNIRGVSIGSGLNHSYFFTGKIGEIIMFDRSLTTNERDSIESYLVKKWNIKIN